LSFIIVKTIGLTVVFKIVIKSVTKPIGYEKAVKSIAKSVEYYYNLSLGEKTKDNFYTE